MVVAMAGMRIHTVVAVVHNGGERGHTLEVLTSRGD